MKWNFWEKPKPTVIPPKPKPFHAGGIPHYSWQNKKNDYTDSQVAGHVPFMSLIPYDYSTKSVPTNDHDINVLNAAMQLPTFKQPRMYVNPMQDIDYRAIQAVMKSTFGGPLLTALTKFLVGTGFRPELELVKPSTDADKNKQIIEEHGYVLEALQEIDRNIDDNEEGFLENSLIDSVTQAVSATNMFNRSALIFEYDRPVEVMGKKYREIPSSLTYAHPSELGIIETTASGQLKAVARTTEHGFIKTTDMIYLWNPVVSAPYRDAKWYGGSMVLPMLDALRTIRRLVGVDLPAMAETSWAGLYFLMVKPQGQTESVKIQEYQQILDNLHRGTVNVLMEDPVDTRLDNVQFDPKIKEFMEMSEHLIKYCIASLGLPNSMFFDEASSNRSTLLGKIQLATSTVIEPTRQVIARQINQQWYMRWFRLLFKDDKAWGVVRPKCTFDDLHIDQWFDKISAVNEIDARHQLLDKAYGELAGIPDYSNRIDPKEETIAGGSANNSGAEFEKKLGDSGSGDPMKRTGSQGSGDSEKRRS